MARARRVVSLHGAAIPIPKRDADVIGKLEELLKLAKDGQAVGLAYLVASPQGHTRRGWVGRPEQSPMLAGIALLYHDMLQAAEED